MANAKGDGFDLESSAINYAGWTSAMITEKMLAVKSLVRRRHDPRETEDGVATSADVFLDAILDKEEQQLFEKMFERVEGRLQVKIERLACEDSVFDCSSYLLVAIQILLNTRQAWVCDL